MHWTELFDQLSGVQISSLSEYFRSVWPNVVPYLPRLTQATFVPFSPATDIDQEISNLIRNLFLSVSDLNVKSLTFYLSIFICRFENDVKLINEKYIQSYASLSIDKARNILKKKYQENLNQYNEIKNNNSNNNDNNINNNNDNGNNSATDSSEEENERFEPIVIKQSNNLLTANTSSTSKIKGWVLKPYA